MAEGGLLGALLGGEEEGPEHDAAGETNYASTLTR
jgi:hypothetical protein